jgi:hypothetical protein
VSPTPGQTRLYRASDWSGRNSSGQGYPAPTRYDPKGRGLKTVLPTDTHTHPPDDEHEDTGYRVPAPMVKTEPARSPLCPAQFTQQAGCWIHFQYLSGGMTPLDPPLSRCGTSPYYRPLTEPPARFAGPVRSTHHCPRPVFCKPRRAPGCSPGSPPRRAFSDFTGCRSRSRTPPAGRPRRSPARRRRTRARRNRPPGRPTNGRPRSARP